MVPPGKTILVIDDEETVLSALEEFLSKRGYGVLTAWTGKEGIKTLKSGNVDLVLLDINLPDEHWKKVAEKIWEFDKQIPIIIITAYSSQESIIEAMDMGIAYFLEKPFPSLDIVCKVIEKVFAESSSHF